MQLKGSCPGCGGTHSLALSVTEEDAGSLVELTAGNTVDQSGNIAASAELVRQLVDLGVMGCPANLPKGRRTVGYGGPDTIYT